MSTAERTCRTSIFDPECRGTFETPGISVVITAYNYARYLPDSIGSALAQEYPTLEVIVVDDGSTDNTPEVLGQFGDRIRVERKANAGLSAARNTGICLAKYPLIAFLDADDIWTPRFLHTMASLLIPLPPEYGMVACAHVLIDDKGTPIVRPQEEPATSPIDVTVRDLIFKSRFSPSSVLVRRDCFDQSGMFDMERTSSEDRDMWIRIATHRKVLYSTTPLIEVRVHGKGMSRNADRMKSNMGAVLRKAFRAGLVPRADIIFWLKAAAFRLFETSWMYHDSGRYWQAFSDCLASLLIWPMPFQRQGLRQPRFFRVRAMARFLLLGIRL